MRPFVAPSASESDTVGVTRWWPSLFCLVLACGVGAEDAVSAPAVGSEPSRAASTSGRAPSRDPAQDEQAPHSVGPAEPTAPAIVLPEVVTSCTPPRRTEAAARLREGVVYSRPHGRPLALDLALPASAGPHPVVLVFHGGGWSAGERGHVRDDIATLAGLGYAGAAVDYRLVDAGRDTSPAQVADARCAVRYLRSHAAELGLDPKRFGALGYSAGGQISLMLGTAEDVPGLDAGCSDVETSPAVQVAIGYFAPVDMRPEARFSRAANHVITRLLGADRRRAPEAAALASPLVHVDGSDAATLLVHGTDDSVVPIEQARMMRSALARAGVPVRLVELEGAGHGFRLFGRGARLRPGTCTTLAFLEATLRDRRPE